MLKKLGRPTKYKKEYDNKIIDFVRNNDKPNVFLEDMAENFDVSVDILYDWADEYDSFHQAFSRARDLAASKFRAWGCEQMVLSKDLTFNGKAWEFVQENLDRAANNRRKKYKKLLSSGTQVDKVQNVLNKVEDGELEVEHADKLIKLIKDQSDIIDKTDIAKRVEAIEKKLK